MTKHICKPCSMNIKYYFDYRHQALLICVSWSVPLILTYYVRKGSWAFYFDYPQINEVRKYNRMRISPINNHAKSTGNIKGSFTLSAPYSFHRWSSRQYHTHLVAKVLLGS